MTREKKERLKFSLLVCTLLFLTLLFSTLSLVFAEKGFVWAEDGCLSEQKDSEIEKRLFLLVLHVEILTFFEVFLTVPMETKQQK